jgi:hypothetical protein
MMTTNQPDTKVDRSPKTLCLLYRPTTGNINQSCGVDADRPSK